MDAQDKKVVLVTGATGGLGTAMCKSLFENGYRVVANYRSAEKAKLWHHKLANEGINNLSSINNSTALS